MGGAIITSDSTSSSSRAIIKTVDHYQGSSREFRHHAGLEVEEGPTFESDR